MEAKLIGLIVLLNPSVEIKSGYLHISNNEAVVRTLTSPICPYTVTRLYIFYVKIMNQSI